MTVFAGDEEHGDDVTSGPLDDVGKPEGITAMAVTAAEWDRLTADRDAMAAALAAATHAYEPCGAGRSDSCDHDYAAERDGDVWLCMATRADPVHQTPDAVRARLAGGAAIPVRLRRVAGPS